MLATVLGILTALSVVGWGTRWYLGVRDRAPEQVAVAPPPRPAPPKPLVPAEEAERMLAPKAPAARPVAESVVEQVEPATEVALPAPTAPAPREQTVIEVAGPRHKQGAAGLPEAQEGDVAADGVRGYCARCRANRYLDDPQYVRTRKGRPAIRGACMICGSGMLVFTSEEAWQAAQGEQDANDSGQDDLEQEYNNQASGDN